MCCHCQDGNAALWHVLYETAIRSAEGGGSFLGLALEELPTSAAELEIRVVTIQAGEAVEHIAPPCRAARSCLMA